MYICRVVTFKSFAFMSFNFMHHPQYLRITSATLIIPFSFYMNNVVYRFVYSSNDLTEKRWEPLFESGLAAILFAAIYAAQAFWSNPVKDSFTHKVDGVIAKLTIVSFLVYVIAYKGRWRDPVLVSYVVMVFYFAALSHWYSSILWCCPAHLFYHGGLHFLSAVSAIYAFLDAMPCTT